MHNSPGMGGHSGLRLAIIAVSQLWQQPSFATMTKFTTQFHFYTLASDAFLVTRLLAENKCMVGHI